MLLKLRAIFIEVAAPVLLLEVLLVGGEVLQVESGGEAEGDDGDDEQRLHGDDGGLLRSTGDRDSTPSPALYPAPILGSVKKRRIQKTSTTFRGLLWVRVPYLFKSFTSVLSDACCSTSC